MFRMWGRLFSDGHMISEHVIENSRSDQNRTAKVFDAIEQLSRFFDLPKPIWLDKNIKEFKKHDKTSFNQGNFIETIEFDCLRVDVIEEDTE